MIRKGHVNGLVGFGAGFVVAALLAAGLFLTQFDTAAASPACISKPLNVSGNINTMSNDSFSLVYNVPGCIFAGGFYMRNVSKFNEGSIKIDFRKR